MYCSDIKDLVGNLTMGVSHKEFGGIVVYKLVIPVE